MLGLAAQKGPLSTKRAAKDRSYLDARRVRWGIKQLNFSLNNVLFPGRGPWESLHSNITLNHSVPDIGHRTLKKPEGMSKGCTETTETRLGR